MKLLIKNSVLILVSAIILIIKKIWNQAKCHTIGYLLNNSWCNDRMKYIVCLAEF